MKKNPKNGIMIILEKILFCSGRVILTTIFCVFMLLLEHNLPSFMADLGIKYAHSVLKINEFSCVFLQIQKL
jgi:hypothetical protein